MRRKWRDGNVLGYGSLSFHPDRFAYGELGLDDCRIRVFEIELRNCEQNVVTGANILEVEAAIAIGLIGAVVTGAGRAAPWREHGLYA